MENEMINSIASQIDEIFLRHRQQILDIDFDGCQGTCPVAVLATGLKNLECFGYTLGKEDVERLGHCQEKAVSDLFEHAVAALSMLLKNSPRNGSLKYKPMYRDFPRQVMDATSAELYLNAMLHYMTNGTYLPHYEEQPYAANAGTKFVPVKLRVLELGSLEDFKELNQNLMNARTSLSESDVNDVRFFFRNFGDAVKYIPVPPCFKENAAILAQLCLEETSISVEEFAGCFPGLFKTPTDVLRLAVTLSKGDASLATPCEFAKFGRSVRRILLSLLDGASCLLENMSRRREAWLRLGERLHPGDYPQFQRANKAFKALRNGVMAHNFMGDVNLACEVNDFVKAVDLLKTRPGEFARNLDRILRNAPNQQYALDAFESVADNVSTRVLLELREHFAWRSHDAFMPSMPVPPELLQEWLRDAKVRRQAKMEAARERMVAKATGKIDFAIRRCESNISKAYAEEEKVEADIQAIRASDRAIAQATYDRDGIKSELDTLHGDSLTRATYDLAIHFTEGTGIMWTDDKLHSVLKKYGIVTSGEMAGLRRKADKLAESRAKLSETILELEFKREDLAKKVRARLARQGKRHPKPVDCKNIRTFFPKGSIAKSYIIQDTLGGIPGESCDRLVGICEKALVSQYSRREPMGRVWLSDKLKQFLVPFSQRSASKALRTVVRGSRIPFTDGAKVVRGFLWWKNSIYGGTDLDLSAMLLDENWHYVEHISFTNTRSMKTNSCYSGDIVNAPDGAAEYVDIDIAAAREAGVRYVVYSVHGYTPQPFCDLPECSFGWMEREEPKEGEIFDASTVQNKIDLASDSRCAIPVVFDLKEKVSYWMDLATSTRRYSCVEVQSSNIISACRAITEMHKPNLYDLARLHAEARGQIVEDREDADVLFDIEEESEDAAADLATSRCQRVITPFDTDIWMAEYI